MTAAPALPTGAEAPASRSVTPGAFRTIATIAARVRSAVVPRLAVVTPLGWGVLATAVLAGWWGLRLAWLELWVLALVGAICLIIAVAATLGRSSYRVRVDLASHRVVVGTRAAGRVAVSNTGSRPLRPARLELPVGQGLASFALPRLRGGASHEELLVIPTARRGIVVVGPALSVRDDPLRLLRREVRWSDPQDLFVHPVTVPLEGSSAGFLRDIEGVATRDLSSNDVSFHALREYTQGDDRRAVHWRTTARTGRLMVRQFEETRRSHLVVALSVRAADYADEEEFELAVSAAASLALQAVRAGREVTVLTQAGTLPTRTAQRLLDAMSGVTLLTGDGHGADGEDVGALARTAAAAVPGASALAVVAGAAVAPVAWHRTSTHVPLGARGFAIACDLGAAATRRALGPFAVLGLGELRDLPRVLLRLEGP